MNSFDIYVDSAANIPAEYLKKHDIKVIPFTCTVNGEEKLCYEDDMPFEETAKKMYKAIADGKDVKTSLIVAEKFAAAAEPTLKAGKDAMLFTLASGISGTYNQALEAKKILESKYPDNKLYVIDSANASMGEGLQALKVADLRDMGESAEACAKYASENAYKINSYFTVDNLKYLRRSGRISTTLAIAGTLLNIKPILKADGGENAKIVFNSQVRGRKKAIQAIAEMYRQRAINPESNSVAITHAGCPEDAEALAELVRGMGAKEVIIEYYDLCTVAHVGPGTLALFFYGVDRKAPAAQAQKKTAGIPSAQKI